MAAFLPGDPSHHGMYEDGSYKFTQDKPDEGGSWYLSRKEIEENSPSKKDGIDLKKEAYLRKSYCTFLQDLGMRLKVPQVTIATAIIFCHRFFLRQSHASNDRRTVATVCMFLAGKVEETPRPLKDVILVSYEIIHKKDPAAVQRIKQKEVYEQQKELILHVERVVLGTLAFDFNVHHPYKPLVEAIKKFKVAQNALAQVAWNFVNDGLRTSLCLQFKPHHIAAGAIFLAAKFLKVKLPSDGERVWWQEFDVTPRQLEEVSNQMLELYEQNRLPPSQGSEIEGSTGIGANHRAPSKVPTASEEHGTSTATKPLSKPASSRLVSDQPYSETHGGIPRTTKSHSNEYGNTEIKSVSIKTQDEIQDHQQPNPQILRNQEIKGESQNTSSLGLDGFGEEDDLERNFGKSETREAGKLNDKHPGRNLEHREGTVGQSPREAIKKIDKDKVKAAMEKRKKLRGDTIRKTDIMDDDDIIERELEDGVELAAESEKIRRERRQSLPKPSYKLEDDNSHHGRHQGDVGDELHRGIKGQLGRGPEVENVEEGEVSALDDAGRGPRSPKSANRKRKAESPTDKPLGGKQHQDNTHRSHHNHHDYNEDRNKLGRLGYSERDHKRHPQENHV